MKNSLMRVLAVALMALSLSVAGIDNLSAQDLPRRPVSITPVAQESATDPVLSLTPLRVDIVIERFSRDNKSTGKLPFTLFARADERAVSLRLGMRVPIRDGASVKYESMGTNIDFIGAMTRDGRFRASITLTDRSLVNAVSQMMQPIEPGPIREYTTSNYVVLRDGESSEFSVGTDPISGETTKAQVTITSLK